MASNLGVKEVDTSNANTHFRVGQKRIYKLFMTECTVLSLLRSPHKYMATSGGCKHHNFLRQVSIQLKNIDSES